MIFDIYTPEKVTEKAKALFKHERAKDRLDGWFIAKEKELQIYDSLSEYDEEVKKALKPVSARLDALQATVDAVAEAEGVAPDKAHKSKKHSR